MLMPFGVKSINSKTKGDIYVFSNRSCMCLFSCDNLATTWFN